MTPARSFPISSSGAWPAVCSTCVRRSAFSRRSAWASWWRWCSELRAWCSAEDPAERVLAARALGQSRRDDLYADLLPLLRDGDQQVRGAALHAAGELKQAQLWPEVIAALSHGLRSQAAAALVAAGDVALPALR